jgi:hypothetical protein
MNRMERLRDSTQLAKAQSILKSGDRVSVTCRASCRGNSKRTFTFLMWDDFGFMISNTLINEYHISAIYAVNGQPYFFTNSG